MRIPCCLALAFACGLAAAAQDQAFRCDALPPDRAAPLVVETRLAGVPALLSIPAQVSAPPILLWHGFGPPASERALQQALPLDELPALKVYLGLPLFGQRAPAGGSAELARRQAQDLAGLLYAPAVLGAADELPAVLAELQARDCLRAGEAIGLFGFSAGGAAVLSVLAERRVRVRAAVLLNASSGLPASVAAYERASRREFDWTPTARRLAKRSDALQRHADIAAGTPLPALLIVHGADDPVLGPQVAEDLYQALRPHYRRRSAPARLQLERVPGMGHGWTEPPQVDTVRALAAAWFDRAESGSARVRRRNRGCRCSGCRAPAYPCITRVAAGRRAPQRRTSKTRLKGVSAAFRKFMKPALRKTSASRFGPARAPSTCWPPSAIACAQQIRQDPE